MQSPVCRSSPELVHDSTRDFSVYVLDPLEYLSEPDTSAQSHVQGVPRALRRLHIRGVRPDA